MADKTRICYALSGRCEKGQREKRAACRNVEYFSGGDLMIGQRLIIVDNCSSCPYGSTNQYGVYCAHLKQQLQVTDKWDGSRDTHPDCKLEDARGFL